MDLQYGLYLLWSVETKIEGRKDEMGKIELLFVTLSMK